MLEVSPMEIVIQTFDVVFGRSELLREVSRDWGEYAFRYKLDLQALEPIILKDMVNRLYEQFRILQHGLNPSEN